VTEHVRIRKIATRNGRPEMLDDGHVVEGDELSPPTPGMPYAVRRTVSEHADAPDVFATSPVRAVITEQRGGIVLLIRQLEVCDRGGRMLHDYVEHYNTHRPHRSLDQRAPTRDVPCGSRVVDLSAVRRRDRLGGLLHEYEIAA